MRKLLLPVGIVLILALVSACVGLDKIAGTFEERFPVEQCKGKIRVSDPEPSEVVGESINSTKGIWLLTPFITTDAPWQAGLPDDVEYINNMNDFLVERIQNKFLRDKWVVDVVPSDFAQLRPEVRDTVMSHMFSKLLATDTINYNDWDIPEALIRSDVPGYSLFMHIEGVLGYDYSIGNNNNIYLFLLDNTAGKVTYADYLKYRCDIRNTDGMDKMLNYAYKKLLDIRFASLSAGD